MLFKISRESPLVPISLLLLLIIGWMEVDLYAPSFPLIRQYFGTTEEAIQWTLSINFIGFFISSLFCGPLSDSIGRRPVLVWGSLIFVLGSLLCVFAPSIEVLLLGRLIQGLGVSAPTTVCVAVIADIYTGDRQVKLLSFMNSAITVVMASAPILGAYLSAAFGWRANFLVIFASAVLATLLIAFILPESHPVEHRKPFAVKQLIKNYGTLLRSKLYMTTVVGLIFLITPYFVFIATIPFLFIETLKLPISEYVYYQGSVVGMFALLSLIVPSLVGKFDADKMTIRSTIVSLLASLALCLVGLLLPDNALTITVLMCVLVLGQVWPCSLLFPATMEFFPELRGSAAALFQSMRMLVMAAAISISGHIYNDTFMPVGVLMFILVAIGVPILAIALRIKRRYR